MSSHDTLNRLFGVIQSRLPARGGDPATSYVARLLHKGPDAFLKKIGEEATEVVLAAKDAEHGGAALRLMMRGNELAALRAHRFGAPALSNWAPATPEFVPHFAVLHSDRV